MRTTGTSTRYPLARGAGSRESSSPLTTMAIPRTGPSSFFGGGAALAGPVHAATQTAVSAAVVSLSLVEGLSHVNGGSPPRDHTIKRRPPRDRRRQSKPRTDPRYTPAAQRRPRRHGRARGRDRGRARRAARS